VPVLLCNVAASCLKLGDEKRMDLLHSPPLKAGLKEKAWYIHCNQAATQAINMEPEGDVAHKVSKGDLLGKVWLALLTKLRCTWLL